MSNEYNEFREEFDILHYIIPMVVFFFMMWLSGNCDWSKKEVKEEDLNDRTTPYTIEDISKFDGVQNESVYIGCNGFVFDVSSSENFSGLGAYGTFAGKDVSIACAYHSTEDKYLQEKVPYDWETTEYKLNTDQEQNLLGFY